MRMNKKTMGREAKKPGNLTASSVCREEFGINVLKLKSSAVMGLVSERKENPRLENKRGTNNQT